MNTKIEYPSTLRTPPKTVNNAEGETVEVILTYEDYQHLLELLEEVSDAALLLGPVEYKGECGLTSCCLGSQGKEVLVVRQKYAFVSGSFGEQRCVVRSLAPPVGIAPNDQKRRRRNSLWISSAGTRSLLNAVSSSASGSLGCAA